MANLERGLERNNGFVCESKMWLLWCEDWGDCNSVTGSTNTQEGTTIDNVFSSIASHIKRTHQPC